MKKEDFQVHDTFVDISQAIQFLITSIYRVNHGISNDKQYMCPGEENGCSVQDFVRIGSCRAKD